MLSIERQEIIRDLLLEKKSVKVSDLSEQFHVSLETIRRDLKSLEQTGIAEKSYGGAILRRRVNNTSNVDFQTLSHIMVDTKQRMAQEAMKLISPNDCIYIDFSTTCAQIARLVGDMPLTVMTNSLDVATQLSEKKNINLYLTGGTWDKTNWAFMGRIAEENLAGFHMDKAFISCRALSMENGISDKTVQESALRRKIAECSNQVIMLADISKFDKITFVKTCGFEMISTLITDTAVSDEWKAFLKEKNVAYIDCSSVRDEPEPDQW